MPASRGVNVKEGGQRVGQFPPRCQRRPEPFRIETGVVDQPGMRAPQDFDGAGIAREVGVEGIERE